MLFICHTLLLCINWQPQNEHGPDLAYLQFFCISRLMLASVKCLEGILSSSFVQEVIILAKASEYLVCKYPWYSVNFFKIL